MRKPVIMTGLDIGSNKISAVVVKCESEGSSEMIAQVSLPSRGVSRGVFKDLNGAVDSVSKALSKLRDKVTKSGLLNIYANISGHTIKAEISKGMIPLSVRGREVTKADIDKCVNVASTIQLPYDRDIVHKITHSFSIDDQPAIKNPIGLYASRLACEMYVITADINHIQNIYKCVNEAGYDLKDVVFTGIADGMSLLNEQEKEEGAMVVDIGASLTEVSIFSGGVIRDIDIIPVGTEDLKGDLIGNIVTDDLMVKIGARKDNFCKKSGSIKHIVITGGMAFTDGIIELMESKLSQPVNIGIARGLKGDISSLDSIKLTTAIGLVRYAESKQRKRNTQAKNIFHSLYDQVVDIFNNYF